MRSAELAAFIRERELISVKKAKGLPRPWTSDPILATYRFCNVRREDDRVTRWLREDWYPDFGNHEDIWFTAVVARLLNLPASLDAVRELVLPFKRAAFARELGQRKKRGEKNFNAAYIVSTNGLAMDKIDYITDNVLSILWSDRERLRPKAEDTLDVYHRVLMTYDGLGSFLAAQVVADLKYVDGCPLKDAEDWWTFAASGPGSRRGLNRVMGWPPGDIWNEARWRLQLQKLLDSPDIKPFRLHAQDLQNCLCEFDKYERARLGEGKPKQLYKEHKDG